MFFVDRVQEMSVLQTAYEKPESSLFVLCSSAIFSEFARSSTHKILPFVRHIFYNYLTKTSPLKNFNTLPFYGSKNYLYLAKTFTFCDSKKYQYLRVILGFFKM